jgi:putative NADPH-quinone reductase
MRVLVLYCHPVESSFNAAVHAAVLRGLRAARHEVDDCDLYAEGFNPVVSREERIGYHDIPRNRVPVEPYVARLLAAEALVIVSPVWNFGFPAMLKGFFDRVFMPGVSFDLVDGIVKPRLHNVGKLTAVMTYGGSRLRAFLAGDPPRKIVTRVLRVTIRPGAPVRHLACYGMDRRTKAELAAFLRRVESEMTRF